MKTMIMIAGMSTLMSGVATASEPNPFDDYDAKRDDRGQDVRQPAPATLEAVLAPEPVLETKAGQWTAGLEGAFSWTTAQNDVSGGSRAKNTNLFVRFTPTVGWFVADNIELGGAFGYLSQSTARRGGGTATESDWMLAASARYHVRLSERFAIVPALALGGYLGSTVQPVDVTTGGEQRVIDEDATTAGFIGSLELGGAYQLSDHLLLRAGLAFTALFGSQSIEATDESLAVRTMNTGLSLGLAYAW